MQLNDDVVGAFVDWCGYRGLDPAETVGFLHNQDWRADENIQSMSGSLPIYTDEYNVDEHTGGQVRDQAIDVDAVPRRRLQIVGVKA